MNDKYTEVIITLYEEEYNDTVEDMDVDDFDYGAGDEISDDNGDDGVIQSVESIYIEGNKILMKCTVDYYLRPGEKRW